MVDGLRLALGTLSVLPAGHPTSVSRGTWRRAMLAAPLVGAVLGAMAWATAAVALQLDASTLLAATSAVAVLVVLTRGLHLDGLADVADALGSRRPPPEARLVMRRSDIGPFGVVTLVLVMMTQVAALASLMSAEDAAVALIGASVVSRSALTWTCRRGVPAADATGLGASVAEVVPRPAAVAVLVAGLVVVVGAGAVLGGRPAAVACGIAGAVALAAAELWRRHCSRRLGGVTGDVLGATEQATWTAFVVTLSLALP